MPSGKPSTASASAPDLEILGNQITIHPGGYGELASTSDDVPERNLVQHMARFREAPLEFLREVSLHVSGTGWRAYDDFIGQPIFYRGFSDQMKAAVLNAPMLNQQIESLAAQRVQLEQDQGILGEHVMESQKMKRKQEIQQSLREVAANLTDAMICKLESKAFIRGAYYISTLLLTRAYHQGVIDSTYFFSKLRYSVRCRNPCFKRGSAATALCRSAGGQAEAINHLSSLS